MLLSDPIVSRRVSLHPGVRRVSRPMSHDLPHTRYALRLCLLYAHCKYSTKSYMLLYYHLIGRLSVT